jgi:hypothetical protein
MKDITLRILEFLKNQCNVFVGGGGMFFFEFKNYVRKNVPYIGC